MTRPDRNVCRYGHAGQIREDGRCKVCNRESARRSANKNYQEVISRATKWNRDNSDRRKEITKKYSEANRQKILEKEKIRRQADPASELAKCRARQAAKIKRTPLWSDLDAIREIYRECRRISLETGIKHHVDHIIPLRGKIVSGLHVPENLRIVPAKENLSKGRRFGGVW